MGAQTGQLTISYNFNFDLKNGKPICSSKMAPHKDRSVTVKH